jgi:hypothetical protein
MAIKVPDQMVYYSERDAKAERILCWIPSARYRDVAVDDEALRRLQQNYPTGVEVRVQPDELEAEGIRLPVTPDEIIDSYKGLRSKGVLHESGMIIARTLERIAELASAGEMFDSLIDANSRQPAYATLAPGEPTGAVRRIAELPKMNGGEEPRTVFRRLSVRQRAR